MVDKIQRKWSNNPEVSYNIKLSEITWKSLAKHSWQVLVTFTRKKPKRFWSLTPRSFHTIIDPIQLTIKVCNSSSLLRIFLFSNQYLTQYGKEHNIDPIFTSYSPVFTPHSPMFTPQVRWARARGRWARRGRTCRWPAGGWRGGPLST